MQMPAIQAAPDRPEPQPYRFGGWTLLLPPTLPASALEADAPPLRMPQEGLQVLAYWQDGKQRALSLQFHASDGGKDRAALRSFNSVRLLKGCKLGAGASIPRLKKPVEGSAPPPLLPENIDLPLPGSERALRRVADVLVADLGTARIQLTEDSPVVRLGLWNSADFCRFELETKNPTSADDDEELRF